MLGVLSDSALDSVNENLGLAQVLAKEGLESLPADRNVGLVFYLMLVLLPSEQDSIFQEDSHKRNLIQTHDTGGGKVIFALLEKIIILQVSFTLINVRKPSFQRLLTWAFRVRGGGNNESWNRC